MRSTEDDEADPGDKRALRGRIRAQRRARRRDASPGDGIDAGEGSSIADAALDHLDHCPAARRGGWGRPGASVAVFRSTPSEPDTRALIDALHARDVRVLVPRTLPDMSLDWHELLPTSTSTRRSASGEDASAAPRPPLSTGDSGRDDRPELPAADDAQDEGPPLGPDAVADVAAMILPGLAVDGAGHRLGQGGGCYDRTLPLMREDTCHAVLLFDEEILDAVPFDGHDRPVPAVLAPGSGWRSLT